jgi:hypothetical protein
MPSLPSRRPASVPPYILYLNSSLLATIYTLSFLDYILEATHIHTLLRLLTLLPLLRLLRLLRLLINLRYLGYLGYLGYFGYSRYSLTSLTQPNGCLSIPSPKTKTATWRTFDTWCKYGDMAAPSIQSPLFRFFFLVRGCTGTKSQTSSKWLHQVFWRHQMTCMNPPPHTSLISGPLTLGACPSPPMMRRGRFRIAPHHCHRTKKTKKRSRMP